MVKSVEKDEKVSNLIMCEQTLRVICLIFKILLEPELALEGKLTKIIDMIN